MGLSMYSFTASVVVMEAELWLLRLRLRPSGSLRGFSGEIGGTNLGSSSSWGKRFLALAAMESRDRASGSDSFGSGTILGFLWSMGLGAGVGMEGVKGVEKMEIAPW